MAFVTKFNPAPAEWLPFQDREVLDRVAQENFNDHQGKNFENPDFEMKVVWDVHNYFAIDLFQRIQLSDVQDKKLVVILPAPENAVFISCVEALNKFRVSCRNVHIFFLYEYANEKGQVAPWQSPYSRSGHFMRYFYQRLDAELRMPMEQIHFFTDDNWKNYSDMIAAEGGADVAYVAQSWSGGIGAIDAESYPAETMEQFLAMGSNYVTPMPEMIAHDSLRGMFGFSGDLGNVPPCAVTVGPKDIAAAKERVDVAYLLGCAGTSPFQRFAYKLSLFGPIDPKIPGSMLRLFPGTCLITTELANSGGYRRDRDWIGEEIEAIRKKEQG